MVDEKKLDELLFNVGDMAYKRRVREIVKALEPRNDENILDCGCGEGFYLEILRQLSEAKLYGVDLDRIELNKAKEHMKGTGVKLLEADVYKLPFKDNFFDKIILSEVLEHLNDEKKALAEIRRVLRRNGTLIVTVPNQNYPFFWDPINKTLESLFKTHIKEGFWAGIWNMHLRLYSLEEITKVLQKAGFTIKERKALTHSCVPFNHLILHAMKRLLNRKVLPKNMRNAAEKFDYKKNKKSKLNIINISYGLLNSLDERNEDIPVEKSSVSLFIKAER